MRYHGIAVLTRIALAVFAFPAAASAQAVARTFDELNVRVRSGETVYVTDNQSRTIDGLLLTVSADALVMEAASGRVTLSVAQVDRVRVRRRDSLKNGILGGLAAGAAGGALAALLMTATTALQRSVRSSATASSRRVKSLPRGCWWAESSESGREQR